MYIILWFLFKPFGCEDRISWKSMPLKFSLMRPRSVIKVIAKNAFMNDSTLPENYLEMQVPDSSTGLWLVVAYVLGVCRVWITNLLFLCKKKIATAPENHPRLRVYNLSNSSSKWSLIGGMSRVYVDCRQHIFSLCKNKICIDTRKPSWTASGRSIRFQQFSQMVSDCWYVLGVVHKV